MDFYSDYNKAFWKFLFCTLFFGGVLVAIGFLINGYDITELKTSTNPVIEKVDLRADVEFHEKFILIRNNNDSDWKNVEIEITSSYLPEFRGSVDLIRSGGTLELRYSEFSGKRNTRLDPSSMKAKKVSIWCNTQNKKGFWYGEM